jgi:hypothetical protein
MTTPAAESMWLELGGEHDGCLEWVLHRRDRRQRWHVVGRLPAAPALGRSPQHVLNSDTIHGWISRQLGVAGGLTLRRLDGTTRPTWRITTSG